MLKVYLVQMESIPGNKPKNFAKVRDMVEGEHPSADSLILLPEMFDTGYAPNSPEVQGNNYGETSQFLQTLSNDTRCTIIGGGARHNGKSITNHSGIFIPSHEFEVAGYDKIHLFFPEKQNFTPGKNITLFKINGFTVAPTICFDLRFPELYREAVHSHATLISIQAAWPALRTTHWDTLLKARAIENQAYVAAVNCITADGSFTGNSQIIDPEGNVIAKAPAGSECIISAEISLEKLTKYRENFPVLP